MPAPVITTISIILSSNKIWNGDILVINSGPPETVTVKMERERDRQNHEKYLTILSIIIIIAHSTKPWA